MQGPVLLQDWVTIQGDKKGVASGTEFPAYTIVPHRDEWLWVGDAQAVSLVVEVKSVVYGAEPGDPKPTLRVETAACETGPWMPLATYDAAFVNPPADILMLRRDPNAPENRQLLGFLRWAITQPSAAQTAWYDWAICFRIVAVVEGVHS